MLNEIFDGIKEIIGLGKDDLTFWQMAVRAIIIYITAITLVRLGESRFMGKNTAFDVILGIILGSVLSRAVTGNAGFFQTIAAGTMLVGLHWLLAFTTFYSDRFGTFVKGAERKLVENGEINWDNMRESHLSKNDLMGAVRSNGNASDLEEVKVAHFERNGDISVVKRDKTPKVVEIGVKEGVQTVRIEIN